MGKVELWFVAAMAIAGPPLAFRMGIALEKGNEALRRGGSPWEGAVPFFVFVAIYGACLLVALGCYMAWHDRNRL